jgi:hypothetical protein
MATRAGKEKKIQLQVREGTNPPLAYPVSSARHLISIIEVAAKQYATLDSDIVYS